MKEAVNRREKMLEREKISESELVKGQDLDSLDLLNARTAPATTTMIITPMMTKNKAEVSPRIVDGEGAAGDTAATCRSTVVVWGPAPPVAPIVTL